MPARPARCGPYRFGLSLRRGDPAGREAITNLSAPQRVKLGISQVPEGRRIFPEMTVLENLELGAFLRKDTNNIKKDLENIYGRFPILNDRKRQMAGTLSGGEQQMLAMGRALMSNADSLLMTVHGAAPLW